MVRPRRTPPRVALRATTAYTRETRETRDTISMVPATWARPIRSRFWTVLDVQCPTAVPGPGPSLLSAALTIHGIQGVSVRAGGILHDIANCSFSKDSLTTLKKANF